MKTCKNFVCQIAVSAAYLLKEIDKEGVENHPCRDIVKVMRKPHLHIGTMGHNMEKALASAVASSVIVLEDKEEETPPCIMELTYHPPPPMVCLPKRDDGANNFRHHGKNSYRKFGGRK